MFIWLIIYDYLKINNIEKNFKLMCSNKEISLKNQGCVGCLNPWATGYNLR